MSKFLNIFSSKNNNKKLVKAATVGEIMVTEKRSNETDNPQNLVRKMSLTKSGRMKEKKRKNISVSEYFPKTDKMPSSPEIQENDADCDDDVFSEDDFMKGIPNSVGRTEIRTA
ncbi:hypothetical protein Zmor_024962 [Zophobas morio]|uniref:Uncharacterized protein n=1 Tax=Zophobas morio TaxID=2755281 RepID=A0AA38HQK6_9CUCU|nr:hypothetical protein Zmor_024962 [Zophobas morio]